MGKRGESMNTDTNPWNVIWMTVSVLGFVAVILGHHHHIITVLIGSLLLTISKDDEDNQSNLT